MGNTTYMVDSCPIILAKGARSGHAKVAGELCEKSYNSSRKEWYYGVKLHAFVVRKPGQLPTPIALFLSGATVHDLTAAKQMIRDNHILSAGNFMPIRSILITNRRICCVMNRLFSCLLLAKSASLIPFVPAMPFLPLSAPSVNRLSVF